MGINELDYNWKFGHAPISDSQSDNTLWCSQRAIRTSASAASGDTNVDNDREIVRDVVNKFNNQSSVRLKTSAGTVYNSSVDILRKRSLPYKLETSIQHVVKGGVNFDDGKDI